MLVITSVKNVEVTYRLVEGVLTTDGVQYSSEVTTEDANTEKVLLAKNLDLKVNVNRISSGAYINTEKAIDVPKNILTVYFEIIVALKASSSATADVFWKAQARNDGGTWVDLFAWTEYADIGTTYEEKTFKGYFNPQTNFNQLPADFQILIKCDEANEGVGKVKSGSYIKVNFLEPLV